MASQFTELDHEQDQGTYKAFCNCLACRCLEYIGTPAQILTPAETHAALDAGQAALLRRRADLVDGLREQVRVLEVDRTTLRAALDSTCAKLAAVTAERDAMRAAMPDPRLLDDYAEALARSAYLAYAVALQDAAARIAAMMGEVVDAEAPPHA